MEVVYENECRGYYICVIDNEGKYEVSSFKKSVNKYTPEIIGYTTEKLLLELKIPCTYVNSSEVESFMQELKVARIALDKFTKDLYNKGITNIIF
ncbi:hypothetical protein [Staphylococcus phage SAP6]|nr:hypothetical protein [Staphylococcus phage vB_SauM-V1SA22]WAW12033.1 hypothetical protein [Staphylococcus phage StAP1]WAW12248.1 hypothetical protein [Staphylococcus phage SAP6]BBI90288.1 hypothetical protein MRS_171 [Staphylococcus phage MR003]BBM81357.1 hypothetical protein [Staphylococcus phage KSAP7]BBM81545.1 hypothetical protein [Staphylococcus phage KSAP11]